MLRSRWAPGVATVLRSRWAPLVSTVLLAAAILLTYGVSVWDLLRYAAYVLLAVVGPGTLLYRALRRTPFTLVEDLVMGAATGLVLELAAWALFSVLDLRGWVWLWPLLVYLPFAAAPTLRRHWRPTGYRPAPLAWSWTIAGVIWFFLVYLAVVFIRPNPVLPTSDQTLQYLDLPYQLSLAGEATHRFPVDLPQVAGDPLYYHWFAYVHMAMTAMVGHIDLPVVALRLAIPALCALTILLTAVVGWRVSGRPAVGAVAAVLFFGVGEFNFTDPVTLPFGTQATFVIWHGMSMIYSWALLVALIAPVAELVWRAGGKVPVCSDPPPALGRRGAWWLAGLLLFASGGAKASSLPVVIAALAFTAAVLVVVRRRVPWPVLGALGLALAAQLFATAALYHFQTYGVSFGPFQGLEPFWTNVPDRPQGMVVLGVWVAFGLNMQLRTAGIIALLWLRRGRLEATQWFLVGGAIAGPAIYLVFSQPSSGNQYFTRAGFAFGVIASAWGAVELYWRARMSRRATLALGAGAVFFCVWLVWAQIAFAGAPEAGDAFSQLVPMLGWAGLLAAVALVAGVAWWLLARGWPPGLADEPGLRALRGRGGLVLLIGILLAGAPGLIMDEAKSLRYSNGGAYTPVPLPKTRVDAARYVRDHSAPTDVVATNVHCLTIYYGSICDPRSFWLSAYAERSVLVEGWGFAPRQAADLYRPFWDPERLRLNDEAFLAPSPQVLDQLRDTYDVRWLVVDRTVSHEAPALAEFATKVYDTGRMAVYRIK
jgi:hypothetical protein